MPNMTSHAPGTFSWADLVTTDPTLAKAFYTSLFAWDATDMPVPGSVYTMLSKGGKNVCALYEMPADMRSLGVPPHWQSYVSVEDVDKAAERALELEATVIAQPFDVMEAGRMAVVLDPGGAKFAMWQANKSVGAGVLRETGALCWHEIHTKDTQGAAKFYNRLFGWTTKTSPGAMNDEYTEFYSGSQPVGGMLKIKPEWGGVPPNWAVYFQVDDCDATLERAQGLGAKAIMPPMAVQGVGRFVFLHDPQGAVFAVIQMEAGA